MEYAIKKNGQYESITFNSDAIQTQGKGTIILQAKIDDNVYTDYLKIRNYNHVTLLSTPETIKMKLVSKLPFNYTINGLEPRYMDKHKIEDYLYEITYGNIDYAYAYKYFKPNYSGGCSAIRNGKIFGRNFDWLYNHEVQFIVHTPTSLDRLAVLGVSGIIPGVEQSNVDDDDIIIGSVDMFKLVPFYLLDGVNEKGVFCTHNIVPLDNEFAPTREIPAQIEEREKICIPMLVRFVLDRFSNAKQAIDYIVDYTTLYFTDEMLNSGYQSHFMIGDNNHTYILEFQDDSILISEFNYITNFNINGIEVNEDNTIIYPPTEYGINKYGMGLERWDIISKYYSISKSRDGMEELLDLIKYSHAYGEPFWYSEFVRGNDDEGHLITVDTDPAICTETKEAAQLEFKYKDRDEPKVWITIHSSIYDLSKKKLWIKNQENESEYTFNL